MLRAPAVMVDTWLTRRKLRKAIKEFRPDTIVSVYPLASLVLGRMRRKKRLRVPVADVPHRLRRALALGAPGHRPSPRGERALGRGGGVARRQGRTCARARWWASASATLAYDRDAVRTQPRPRTRRPCGARASPARGASATSSPPSRRSARAASSTRSPCAASDEKLQRRARERGYGTVIGWTDEMPALMTAADALVENAGGLTCMEAFAVGLPVITFQPIAGHGKDNAEMMARVGRQPLRARRGRAARRCSARSPRPGPSATQLVDTAHGALRRRPRRRRRGARARPSTSSTARAAWSRSRTPRGRRSRTDRRRERGRALRRAHARRPGGVRDRRRRGQAAEGRHRHRVRRCAARPRPARRPRRCWRRSTSIGRVGRRSTRRPRATARCGLEDLADQRRRHRQRRMGQGHAAPRGTAPGTTSPRPGR